MTSTITVGGEIIRKCAENEAQWAGDFRLSYASDPTRDLRSGAYYYGVASNLDEVSTLLKRYNMVFPRRVRLADRPKRRHQFLEN